VVVVEWGNGLYHRRRRWHGLRLYIMVIVLPQHTQIYIHIIVCEALMCCCCRCVGRSVGCVRVCGYGVVVVVHTPGIAVCAAAAALPRLPPFIRRRLCAYGSSRRSIQLCRVCAWTRSLISLVCVCVLHTHTPTPPPTLSNTQHTHAYEQSRMHSKGNMYMCMNTRWHSICTYI
jgi:hypothetical protein